MPSAPFISLPAPPPEFELQAWRSTLNLIRAQRYATIYPTHFGPVHRVDEHLACLAELLEDLTGPAATPTAAVSAPATTPPAVETPQPAPQAATRSAPSEGGGSAGKWIAIAVVLVGVALLALSQLSDSADEPYDSLAATGAEGAGAAFATANADMASMDALELSEAIDHPDPGVRRGALAKLESDHLTDDVAVGAVVGQLYEIDLSPEGRAAALQYLSQTGISAWDEVALEEAQEWCAAVEREILEPEERTLLADFEAHLAAVIQQL